MVLRVAHDKHSAPVCVKSLHQERIRVGSSADKEVRLANFINLSRGKLFATCRGK